MGKFFLGSKYNKFLFLSVWNDILHLLLLVNFYSPFKSSSYQTPPTFRKWFSLIILGKTEIIIWGFLHLLIMNLQKIFILQTPSTFSSSAYVLMGEISIVLKLNSCWIPHPPTSLNTASLIILSFACIVNLSHLLADHPYEPNIIWYLPCNNKTKQNS